MISANVGDVVKVVAKNIGFDRGAPSTNIYYGTVVKNEKYDSPDSLSITTGQPAYTKFPVRNILLRNIISIEAADGTDIAVNKQADNDNRQYVVDGSKGNQYIVSVENGRWSCTCQGFQFRRQCRHVVETKRNGWRPADK